MASLCRFPKKNGKNKGTRCRFARLVSKKIKKTDIFFYLTNWLTKNKRGISGGGLPGFAVSGNNRGQLVPRW